MSTTQLPTHTLCINCSYDLSGLQKSAVCPECGKPFELNSIDRHNDNKLAEPLQDCIGDFSLCFLGLALSTLVCLVAIAIEWSSPSTRTTQQGIAPFIWVIAAAANTLLLPGHTAFGFRFRSPPNPFSRAGNTLSSAILYLVIALMVAHLHIRPIVPSGNKVLIGISVYAVFSLALQLSITLHTNALKSNFALSHHPSRPRRPITVSTTVCALIAATSIAAQPSIHTAYLQAIRIELFLGLMHTLLIINQIVHLSLCMKLRRLIRQAANGIPPPKPTFTA